MSLPLVFKIHEDKKLIHHHTLVPKVICGISLAPNTCMLSCCSHIQLFQTLDHNLPGSFVNGISQERILKWTAVSSSRGFSQPRNQNSGLYVSCIGK